MARRINKFGLFVVLFIALTLLYILTKGYDIDYGSELAEYEKQGKLEVLRKSQEHINEQIDKLTVN